MLLNFSQILSRFFDSRFHHGWKGRRPRPKLQPVSIESLEPRTLLTAPLVAEVLKGTAGTTVTGTVYDDLDSNGVKSHGENGVSGWTVYLDLDNSGTLNNDAVGTPEPSAVTNVDGDFVIGHLIPGTYRVSEVVQNDWTPTALVSQYVSVVKDKDTKVDFFNFSGGDIIGTVWSDLNGDGLRAIDPLTGGFTDPGLSSWTVFLDLNKNKSVDPGEPSTLTDANGSYSFFNLPEGDYEVTEIQPAGWDVSPTFDIKQTAAVVARQQVTQDFANYSLVNGSIQGTIWNDLNADGVRAADPATGEFTDPALSDWTVFLDLNGNRVPDAGELSTVTDANGYYAFISLPAGDYEVTEVLPAGWDVSPTFDPRQTVAVSGGAASTASDFANFTVLNGSIRGTVWNDLNRDGIRNADLAGTFSDPGLQNWQVFLDLNRNKLADVGEPTALTDVSGNYAFTNLQVGDYEVQEILPARWETTVAYDNTQTVSVFSGMETLARDFANFNLTTATAGSVSGTVWNDLNGNGIRETSAGTGAYSDPGLANWLVFVDLDANGILDVTDPQATTAADGTYTISGIVPGTVTIIEVAQSGWRATSPIGGTHTLALKNGEIATGLDFGNYTLQEAVISGIVFADTSKDGVRSAGERGLAGLTVYLDLNENGALDASEPQTTTSGDLFFTPAVDEAGTYSFTHLVAGTYTVRSILPETLSATPLGELSHTVTLTTAEQQLGVNTAAVFRPNEIRGVKFDDVNGNHVRDAGEPAVSGATIFVDLNRNNNQDPGEPTTNTGVDGSYEFGNLTPGAYIVREVVDLGYSPTYPNTIGGILWPAGVSNSAVGDVTPGSITTSLAVGATFSQTVSITLPNSGALTNLVDVFLLFDDTGSFTNNSPIVRAAFPAIMTQLQAALPGIDLGFGVGRFEEYGNFAYEYSTGRPFILNQPIVAASTPGYDVAIQAALNRTTPGYGGDQPETDIEALYQLVTGVGFDGNNNGSVLDSGAAGLASTQLTPGDSGDVPSFASFQADAANSVLPAAGNVGGGGFRAGALPIILTATDTGFAFQPRGETSIIGVGGTSLPVSSLTQTSRSTTPFDSGAGIQQTVTALNALGALVIGLGTNTEANLDPRQGLESLSTLTGAVNHTTTTIANGTVDPISPGDPLYFQISSGFAASVADGVVNAIQNAATNVAVDITVQASDPRVKIINHSGVRSSIGSGQTASFDIEFIGDGIPHRFDLQFVRAGTNVVLGSIPVVLGTPVAGNGYHFEDLPEGEIHSAVDFGSHLMAGLNQAPIAADGSLNTSAGTAINGTLVATDVDSGSLLYSIVTNPNHGTVVMNDTAAGTYTYTPIAGYSGSDSFTFRANDGALDSNTATIAINVVAVNAPPVAANSNLNTAEDTPYYGSLVATDGDSVTLTFHIVANPAHGSVVITDSATGAYTYTSTANYNGPDSFTFKADDGALDSNVATVSINVMALNDAPVAVDFSLSTAEDTSTSGTLTASDVDSATLTYRIVANASHGTAILLDATSGAYTYTPAPNYNGPDSFTFIANDGSLDSNHSTVSLTVIGIDDAPVAVEVSLSTLEDTAASGVLAAVDVDSASLMYSIIDNPAQGTVIITNIATGAYIYTPAANYNGVDSFTFQASDGLLVSNVAVAHIVVTAANDAPTSGTDNYSLMADSMLSVAATGILANDHDVDGDPLTAALVLNPMHGVLVFNSDGSFTYTPQSGYSGPDGFSYQASDGNLSSPITQVNLLVSPIVPPATPQFVIVDDSRNALFTYTSTGGVVKQWPLSSNDRSPQGVTSSADGKRLWVADTNGIVFVYDGQQKLIGRWQANGIEHVAGVTTDGTDIWLVDSKTDAIYRFAGACTRLSGKANPTSTIRLNSSNKNPTDLVTDGQHLWVLNDTATVDKVFRYSMSGVLEGSWTIDGANSNPTGLTLNPEDPNQFWILDGKSRKLFAYIGGASRRSGNQNASSFITLSNANREAEGVILIHPAVSPTATPAGTAAMLDSVFQKVGFTLPRVNGR